MAVATLKERIRKPNSSVARIGACIYGKGGSGKTTLLGTMPGRGLVLDIPQVEGGTFVLADHADRIDVADVTEWDQFEQAYQMLRDRQTEHVWVAIDSITAAQELAKRKVLRDRGIMTAGETTDRRDWGRIGELMSELFYRYRTLPMHVIYTAQERLRETGDVHEYQPTVSPMSLDALLPSLTLVGRLSVREEIVDGGTIEERLLRVGSNPRYSTKVRAAPGRGLPAVIRNPNLGHIFGYLLGGDVPRPEGFDLASSNPFAPAL